jgi:hypothetical protein
VLAGPTGAQSGARYSMASHYNVLAGDTLCLKLLFERVHGQRD